MQSKKIFLFSTELYYLGSILAISLLLPTTSIADATASCNVGVGSNSTECGVNALSNGDWSTTLGNPATAAGDFSVSIGHSSSASNTFSTANGAFADASGDQSTAFGSSAIASGLQSTAIGRNTIASADSSVANGHAAWAQSNSSVSIGYAAGFSFTNQAPVTDSLGAISIGRQAYVGPTSPAGIAIGFRSAVGSTSFGAIAIGSDVSNNQIGSVANAIGSIALGAEASSLANNSIAIGQTASTDSSLNVGAIAIGGDLDLDNKGAQAQAAGAIALGADVINDVPNSMLINVPLRIEADDSTAGLKIEETNTAVAVRNVIQMINNGPVGFELEDTNLANSWDFRTAGNGGFLVSNIGTPGSKLQINKNGSVFLNGAGFFLNGNTNNVTVAGTHTAIQHIASSSREVKKDFTKINTKDVMSKIKDLEVTKWSYKDTAAKGNHIGPMAEDFYKLFELGADDKHVSATDMASIAIIAAKELQKENIDLKKGLHLKTTNLKNENKELKKQIENQNKRLAQLEKLVMNLASGQKILPLNGKQVVSNQ